MLSERQIHNNLLGEGVTLLASPITDLRLKRKWKSHVNRFAALIHVPPLLFVKFLDNLKAQNEQAPSSLDHGDGEKEPGAVERPKPLCLWLV